MIFSFVNSRGVQWYLHSMIVELKGSKIKKQIYFFKKNIGTNSFSTMPKGFTVVESKRNGLPVLKRLN